MTITDRAYPDKAFPDKMFSDKMYPTHHLPEAVTQVRKEVVKSFSHSKRVGGYLLGRTLGVGSFAKVKEGLHLTTGEKVAIKVIDKKRTKTDNYVRKNLRREGRLLQLVRHPNIVSLLEVMETDNSYYLVTEICKGGDLMEYISSRKRLSEMEVTRFIGQIVSAVDYLHRLGIIHRDLKIENLLLDGNRDIKLIDFGLSNFIKVVTTPEGAKSQEFCVTQCGSPAYAAPELLNHEKYGLQVDLWSIGVNMYAMLTGGLPFTVEPFNIKALYAKMRDRQMNPLPDDLSRECRDLLRKFLNPDPTRRVTIGEALNHPWLIQGGNKSISRVPCPNKIKTSDLEPDVLSHMSENLGFRMGEVIKFVTCNTPSPACATYHLLVEKLRRYNAKLRSSGQVPAALISRSSGDEGQGRITLHLRDMRSKQLDSHRNNSTGNGTPTSRAQSRAITSVATDATDTTVATTGSGGRRELNGRNKHAAGDAERKENQRPRRTSDARIIACKSPSLSDIATSMKHQACSEYPLQTTNQKLAMGEQPLSKGNTALGVIINHRSQDSSNDGGGVNPAPVVVKSTKTEHGYMTRIQTNKVVVSEAQNNNWNTPSANTIIVKLTPRNLAQVQQKSQGTGGGGGQSEKLSSQVPKPFLESTNVNNSNNNNNNSSSSSSSNAHRNGFPDRSQHSNPFTQHRKVLTRQTTTGRSFDHNNNSNNNNNNNNNGNNNNNAIIPSTNEKIAITNGIMNIGTDLPIKHTSNFNPEPSIRKIIPKQFVPFRSAQDRPKASKNYGNGSAPLRQSDKPKGTSDNNGGGGSMALHGKPVRRASEEECAAPPPVKRPGSPHRPVIVRRRLVKRHRLGDITGSGGQMIRDVDQSVTMDLFGSDVSGSVVNSHHISTPLPSIGQSQSNTPR